MGGRCRWKPDRPVSELCHGAADLLKQAGFVFHCASRSTEACYYRWPGKQSLIRIAAHSKDKANGLSHVAGKITFGEDMICDKPGYARISDEAFRSKVARGIGEYFLKAKPAERKKDAA